MKKYFRYLTFIFIFSLIALKASASQVRIIDTLDSLDRDGGFGFTMSALNAGQCASLFKIYGKVIIDNITWSGIADPASIESGRAEFIIQVYEDINGLPKIMPLYETRVAVDANQITEPPLDNIHRYIFALKNSKIFELKAGTYWISILAPDASLNFGWSIEKDRLGTILGSGGALRLSGNNFWQATNSGVDAVDARGWSLLMTGVRSEPLPDGILFLLSSQAK
uniref:hypothetical protein n=1 Tax=Candidatus Electronema sp. TaxID=2698783 RepID=UPI004055B7F8